jgi:hypothetical protein
LGINDVELQQLPDLLLAVLHIDDIQLQPPQALGGVSSIGLGVSEGREVEGAVGDPPGGFAEVLVLLDGEGDQLIAFLAIELHLPSEEHPHEAGAAEVRILSGDSLGEVVLQFRGGVSQVEELLRSRAFHQGLELLPREGAEETVVHFRPPFRPSV